MIVKRIVFLGVILCCFSPQAHSTIYQGWKKNVIGDQSSPIYLYVKDIDGDGDLDVASTTNRHPLVWNSEVAWFRNNLDQGTAWEKFIISSGAPEDNPLTNTNGIVVSDIDKDGREDVVVGTGKVTENLGSVYWFKAPQDPTGVWQKYDIELGASNSYFKVYTMDVNEDAMEDIIIGGRQLAVIYINPGNPAQPGTLWEKIPMDAQTGSALYLDDVNGDGKTDIVNSYLHGNISWIAVDYVGGEVVFERTMIDEALDYAFDVNCIDVNSDLKKDVLVSTLTVPGLHWYEAPANSGDPWTQHTVSTTFNGTDIYTGDINGDMKIDLAVSGAYTDKISWFEYAWVSGEYQWTEHVIDDGVNDPGDISLDDIDEDGDLDLVVAGLREDQMIWYENRLNDWDDDEILNAFDNCPATPNGPLLGTCVKAVSGVVVGMGTACNTTGDCAAGETCDLAQGDINGNGCGNACECYADINGSGKVDLSDLVIMKGEFAKSCPPSPCAADNNGDGKVDLQDLVVMKIQFLRTGCPC